MHNLSKALAVVLVASLVPASIVVAQQADGSPPEVSEHEGRRGPSPEVMARMEDGRIAMAKEALKLTPEQEKLWASVEEKVRANYADMRKHREERRQKRAERREARKDKDRERLALPERIEKRSERMAARAARMSERAEKAKEFAEVVKPFYASLSAEQKEVADHLLRRFAGGKKWHKHHGWHGKRMCKRGGWGGRGHHGKDWY